MKKYDNFCGCLEVLCKSDRKKAAEDEIYRTGVIGQFNLTFELAWKLLQKVLRLYSVTKAQSRTMHEIIELGLKFNFIDNEEGWLLMQRDRNNSVHIYNEADVIEIADHIFEVYIPLFKEFKEKMAEKIRSIEE